MEGKRKYQKLTAEDHARHEELQREVRARIAERRKIERRVGEAAGGPGAAEK